MLKDGIIGGGARAAVVGVVTAGACAGLTAQEALAFDDYPCAKVSSATQPQACPLTWPLAGDRIPVYDKPVANPRGATPPGSRSHLQGVNGKAFTCQQRFPAAMYYHPKGWRNNWWASTVAADGKAGWVPQVFFKGGADDEPDGGLRICATPPAPAPPPPPAPPPADPCTTTPAATGFRITARFLRGGRSATTRYRQRPIVHGRLRLADGKPVSGAAVCVGVQARSDRPVASVNAITTDARGGFTYRLSRGHSRRVCFVHRSGGAASSACVDVRVKAPVAFRASRRSLRNGQSVLFRGRLKAPAGARGRIVELQSPVRGGWRTFATARVRRGGKFRHRYRFTRTFGTRIYRLRALMPSQRGYPFAAGASRTVRVRVAG